jgi:hypothetical protein
MTYDLDNISSWTAYKSRALAESVEASEPNSRIEQIDLMGESPSHHPSREALQKNLNLSNDDLQVSFKWMRPHPALFLQAASKSTSSKAALEASRIVNINPSKQTKKRDRATPIQTNIIFPSESDIPQQIDSSVARPTISVDLTQFLDPPLLSEWLPGQDISTLYGKSNITVDASAKRSVQQIASGYERNDHDLPTHHELRNEIMNIFITNSASISNETMEMIENLSDVDWMEIFPSHALVNALDKSTPYKILKALGRLLAISSSQGVGTHVMKVLIPVFFESLESDAMPKDYEECLNEIALHLIDRCGLGNLPKLEALKLINGIPKNTCGIKLRLSLAREYYSYKKRSFS